MTTKGIEWRTRPGNFASGENGYVGSLHFFTYHYSGGMRSRSETEKDARTWTLTCHLPGAKVYKYATTDECKAGAQRLLALFVERIAA